MEQSEGPVSNQFFELEAPEHLNPDQNLFDQPPFNATVSSLEERLHIDTDKARGYLGGIVDYTRPEFQGAVTVTLTHGFRSKSKAEQVELITNLTNYLARFNPGEIELARKSVLVSFQNLLDYPYWGEYIGTHTAPHAEYDLKGTPIFRKKEKYRLPIDSYAKWSNEKLKREKKLSMKGIDEVFPSEINVGAASSQNKRWRILRASEFIT